MHRWCTALLLSLARRRARRRPLGLVAARSALLLLVLLGGALSDARELVHCRAGGAAHMVQGLGALESREQPLCYRRQLGGYGARALVEDVDVAERVGGGAGVLVLVVPTSGV